MAVRPRSPSPPASKAPRPKRGARRPLQDRAVATRERLLRATLEALLAKGYGGTTTQEVCRRAGVSRGTLLHHFPTRSALIAETARFLFEERMVDFTSRLESLPLEGDRVRAAVRLLWKSLDEPIFFAFLEVSVAARTDRALRRELERVYRWYGKEIAARSARFFGSDPERVLSLPNGTSFEFGVLPNLLLSLLSWLAIDRFQLDRAELDKRLEVIEGLAAFGIEWAESTKET